MEVTVTINVNDVFETKTALRRVLDDLDLIRPNSTYNVWSKLGEENVRIAKVKITSG